MRRSLLDGQSADRHPTGLRPPLGGLGVALADERGDSLPPLFRAQVLPARQGRKLHRVGSGKLKATKLLAVLPGGGFLRAVEPLADQKQAVEERLDAGGGCG
jgi:hypothetical protein